MIGFISKLATYKIIFSLFFLTLLLPSLAQNYYFKTIDRENGLSNNTVYDIMQDKQGFIWLATQKGLNRYDGKSFKVFAKEPKLSNGLTSNSFFTMVQDKEGIIWIGTDDGLFTYNPATEFFTDIELRDTKGEKIRGAVRSLFIDKMDNIWIAMTDTCLFRMSAERRSTCWSLLRNMSQGSQIKSVCSGPDNRIWVATSEDGLIRLIPETGEIKVFHNDVINKLSYVFPLGGEALLVGTTGKGALKFNLRRLAFEKMDDIVPGDLTVFTIFKDSKENLWVGTEKGLYGLTSKGTEHFTHISNDKYSLSGNLVLTVEEDREGGLWIGTFSNGANYYSEFLSQFEKYYPAEGPGRISGHNVSQFQSDGAGGIWIGTEDGGLNRFDIDSKSFSRTKLQSRNIHSLAMVDDRLWVGTYGDGLFQLDTAGNPKKLNIALDLSEDNIYSIKQDHSGRIWLGTDHGLFKAENSKDRFVRMNPQNITVQVNDILEDFNGILWFATQGEGVFRYDSARNIWQNTSFDSGNESYGGKNIICLLEDNEHNIWIGTDGAGIYLEDNSKNVITKHLTTDNGLPDGVVLSLVQDSDGFIWGSTNRGIFRFCPTEGSVQRYNMESGLPYDQFNPNSSHLAEDGKICFGGIEGFIAFNPCDIKVPQHSSSLIFNHFQLFNNHSGPGSADYPLEKSVTCAKEIVLHPGQDVFSIGFTDLIYAPSPETSYSYRLAGLDKDWIDIPQPQDVTYSKLPTGNYIFEARAMNKGQSNEDGNVISIAVKVLPPFYKSKAAKILYALLAMLLICLTGLNLNNRIKARNKLIIKQMEDEKERDLYNSKIEFFTNITHEIRTPLTLIKVPLDDVIRHTNEKDPNYEKLSIIKRNSDRLLKLANELLDFKKIGSEKLNFNFTKVNISNLLKYTVGGFIPSATVKELDLSMVLPDDDIFADADSEILTKIISNLLSNACKHASKKVQVRLFTDKDHFKIEISNDGDPIPDYQSDRIFKPFVKLDPNIKGSGIGLPFARNLTESHGGRLILDKNSDPVTFLVDLPLRQETSVSLSDEKTKEATIRGTSSIGQTEGTPRKRILVVDDNIEFLDFMKGHLEEYYEIATASNGKEGLKILANEKVDLIICDLMMPVMDGIEMTKAVKSDLHFSHIPIILLTAKSDLQSKIEGLNADADEYITKPFSSDYLKARINNLLSLRSRILDAFQHSPELSFETITHSKTDGEFMRRLAEAINSRLENSNLDVNELADAMAMSRATLYRKVRSVSELTPNDFIRLCRLKKAAQLLMEKEYNINEVSYIVGFSSPSYFSKCFYKQFGVLPKDYDKEQYKR